MTVMVPRNRMLLVAAKKIRCLPDKKLEDNLSYFCGSMADAYRVGVEEAQGEIMSRLQSIPTHICATAKPGADQSNTGGKQP